MRILHLLLDGYRPDADAHPGAGGASRGFAAPAAAAVATADAGGHVRGTGVPPVVSAAGGGGPGAGRLPYRALVVPADGFGTGRARLHTDAPRTFAFLKRQVGI